MKEILQIISNEGALLFLGRNKYVLTSSSFYRGSDIAMALQFIYSTTNTIFPYICSSFHFWSTIFSGTASNYGK